MTRTVRSRSWPRAWSSPRAGGAVLFWLVGLCLIAVTGGVGWYLMRGDREQEEAPLLAEVIRGPYEHIVLEQGEVESNNNVEIRCEVKARDTHGPSTAILEVIPEGTWVQKGDWLITFDSSALEQKQRMQKIVVNTSEATMIEAKAVYDTALIAKTEYLEGTYKELEQTILNEIFVAEEALKKAQLSLDSVKRLVARGLLTALQMEGEEYRVNAAENVLQLAKRKLEVLEKYTRVKTLTQMESDIQSARVRSENEKDNYEEELNEPEGYRGPDQQVPRGRAAGRASRLFQRAEQPQRERVRGRSGSQRARKPGRADPARSAQHAGQGEHQRISDQPGKSRHARVDPYRRVRGSCVGRRGHQSQQLRRTG